MSSTKRMIYQMEMPDIAVGPGPQPLGSIQGRGVMVPAVDCPKPRNGNRSALAVCLECTSLEEVGAHHITCGYQASAQDLAELQRRMGPAQGPMPGQPRGAAPDAASPHAGVQPPVPPNVFTPNK